MKSGCIEAGAVVLAPLKMQEKRNSQVVFLYAAREPIASARVSTRVAIVSTCDLRAFMFLPESAIAL